MKYLVIFLLAVSFNFFCYSQNDSQNSVEFYFLELLNEHREKIGIPTLEIDQNLSKTAQDHANYIHYEVTKIGNKGGYSHIQDNINNPYYSGLKPIDRLSKYTDTKCKKAGENVCMFYMNFWIIKNNKELAQSFFDSWLSSPSHKKTMLDGSYKKIGLGFESDKNGNKIKNGYAVLLLTN